MTRPLILVDIDHTVSDAAWRDPMIGGEGGWDAYHLASAQDEANPEVVELVRILSERPGTGLVGLTARPEKWRQLTQKWLLDHDVPLDAIWMRPNDDYSSAAELKPKLCAMHMGEGWQSKILFVMDDREDVAAAFRAENVTVLQVHARRQI